MSVRSRPHSPNYHEEKFEPLQAFLLKNTNIYPYPRQHRRPRNRMKLVDTMKAIGQRLLYFLIFYTFIGLAFLGYIHLYMYFQVPRDHPGLTGMHSALQMNPGLSHVPNPDLYSNLLYFRTREKLHFHQKSDTMAAYLHIYQDNAGPTNYEDCVKEGGYKQDPRRPCMYDIKAGGPCNIRKGFGFDTARTCFALKMNRIYGWLPDPIDDFATGVLVKCSGVTADDTYNLGAIRYYDMDYKFSANPPTSGPGKPTNGSFHSMYFPYRSQGAYLQPLVFVAFGNVKRNIYIRVRCWLIAKNIKVDFERGEGSTQFAMIYD